MRKTEERCASSPTAARSSSSRKQRYADLRSRAPRKQPPLFPVYSLRTPVHATSLVATPGLGQHSEAPPVPPGLRRILLRTADPRRPLLYLLGLCRQESPRSRRRGAAAGTCPPSSHSQRRAVAAAATRITSPIIHPLPPQLYLPRFLDKSEQRGGREWEAFRLARPWRLVHRFFGTVSVREAPLDPAQQYLICMHPHGIVVLSKFFYYGAPAGRAAPPAHCLPPLVMTPPLLSKPQPPPPRRWPRPVPSAAQPAPPKPPSAQAACGRRSSPGCGAASSGRPRCSASPSAGSCACGSASSTPRGASRSGTWPAGTASCCIRGGGAHSSHHCWPLAPHVGDVLAALPIIVSPAFATAQQGDLLDRPGEQSHDARAQGEEGCGCALPAAPLSASNALQAPSPRRPVHHHSSWPHARRAPRRVHPACPPERHPPRADVRLRREMASVFRLGWAAGGFAPRRVSRPRAAPPPFSPAVRCARGCRRAYDLIRPPRIIKDFFLKTLKARSLPPAFLHSLRTWLILP